MQKRARLKRERHQVPMRALRDRGGKHPQHKERGDDRSYAHRIAADPRYRSVIIGGSDSEHASIDSRRFAHASDVRGRAKKFLENRPNRKKFVFRSIPPGSTSSNEKHRARNFATRWNWR